MTAGDETKAEMTKAPRYVDSFTGQRWSMNRAAQTIGMADSDLWRGSDGFKHGETYVGDPPVPRKTSFWIRFEDRLDVFAVDAKAAYRRMARKVRTDLEENHEQATRLNDAYQFIVRQLGLRGIDVSFLLAGLWVLSLTGTVHAATGAVGVSSPTNLLAGGFLAILTAWLYMLQRRFNRFEQDERQSHDNIAKLAGAVGTLSARFDDIKSDILRSDERNYEAHEKILDLVQKVSVRR